MALDASTVVREPFSVQFSPESGRRAENIPRAEDNIAVILDLQVVLSETGVSSSPLISLPLIFIVPLSP